MGVSRQPSATDTPPPPFGRALLPAPFLRHYGRLALDQAHENSATGSSPTPSSLRDAHRQTRALPGTELARRVWAATGGSVTQLLSAAKLAEHPPAVHAPPSPWILPPPLQHIDGTTGVGPTNGTTTPLVEAILSLAGHLELLSSGVGSPIAVFDAAICALSAAVKDPAAHKRPRAGTGREGLYPPGSGDSDTARWGVALPAIHIIRALMVHDGRCRAAAVASCAVATPLVRPASGAPGRSEEAVAGGYRAQVERVRVISSGGGSGEVAVVGSLSSGRMDAEVASLSLR